MHGKSIESSRIINVAVYDLRWLWTQLGDEELVRTYEEATTKNIVFAAGKSPRAERESQLAANSCIPSLGDAHVSDKLQVLLEILGSCYKQGPLQDGLEEESEVEWEASRQVQ